MSDQIREFVERLRCNEDGSPVVETPETVGQTMTKAEFMDRIKKEKDGEQLLYLLECGEWRICERLGLCHGYFGEDGKIYFDVPRWNNLVAHLTMVHGCPEDED